MNDTPKNHRLPVPAEDAAEIAQARPGGLPEAIAAIAIIARRCPWPGLHERRDRSGLSLRWDALTETGDMLAPATTHPLHDGAFALLSRGADPEALVTMRHEGAAHDSFVPLPLRIPAAPGAKRAEGRARLAEHRAENQTDAARVRDRTPVDGFQMAEDWT